MRWDIPLRWDISLKWDPYGTVICTWKQNCVHMRGGISHLGEISLPCWWDLTSVGWKFPIWTNSSEPAHFSGMNLSIIRRRESNKQWKPFELNDAIKFKWLSGSPCRAEIHHMNMSWNHPTSVGYPAWVGYPTSYEQALKLVYTCQGDGSIRTKVEI